MFPTPMSLLTTSEERQARPIDGGASSRGLLVSVLGEFVRPHGGSAWTQTLIDAMGALGVTEKATRQVLARLDERGWLSRTKDGRRTRWHLTSTSQRVLDDGAERIYAHGRADRTWDGRWSVVLASLPDEGRGDRHRMTTGLTWAGYGSLGQGTWISPWVDREIEAVRVLDAAGVELPTSFVAEVGRLGSGRDLAARAWDLTQLADDYRTFVGDARRLARPTSDGGDSLAAVVSAVHGWRRFPFADPHLPTDLLPAGWPLDRAVGAFDAVRAEHHDAATAWWLDREGGTQGD